VADSVTRPESARALKLYRDSAKYYSAADSENNALVRYQDSLEDAREYLNSSNAESTRKAYESDWKVFTGWCQSVDAIPLPASPETVCGFLATEAKQNKKSISTLRRRSAAIRLMHIARNLPSPHESKIVSLVLKGIALEQRENTVRRAMAATDKDLKRMIDAMDLTTPKGVRDRALLLVGFDGAFRRSELIRLTVEMIELRPDGLLINLPYSKTDQTGEGQIIPILSRPGSAYCPVESLQRWLTLSGCKEGLIFKRLHKGNRVGESGLSAQSVSLIMKFAASQAGFSTEEVDVLSGHSLRRGVMTESARAGATVSELMSLGRHKKADTAMKYVEKEKSIKNSPTKSLLR